MRAMEAAVQSAWSLLFLLVISTIMVFEQTMIEQQIINSNNLIKVYRVVCIDEQEKISEEKN